MLTWACHLALKGRCFVGTFASYEYRVCPFHNVTQHDVQSTWNAYNGVLGVYDAWEIGSSPPTFAAQKFTDGDAPGCGEGKSRRAEVRFVCGEGTGPTAASEPEPCAYDLDFETPAACGDGLSVLPMLQPETSTALAVEGACLMLMVVPHIVGSLAPLAIRGA